MIRVTKEFVFDCAHKLNDYDGPCGFLHGHTYKLHVTLKGKPGNNGMVLDFNNLKKIVSEKIVSKIDHKYLNDIGGLSQPTAENMVVWIWNILSPEFGKMLYELKLWETPTSFTTYRGDEDEN